MQLEELVSKLDRVEYLLKHMPGRHNQLSHTPKLYLGGAEPIYQEWGEEKLLRGYTTVVGGLKKRIVVSQQFGGFEDSGVWNVNYSRQEFTSERNALRYARQLASHPTDEQQQAMLEGRYVD